MLDCAPSQSQKFSVWTRQWKHVLPIYGDIRLSIIAGTGYTKLTASVDISVSIPTSNTKFFDIQSKEQYDSFDPPGEAAKG